MKNIKTAKANNLDPLLYKTYRDIAFNLLNLRKRQNVNQIEFARRCGISRFTYLRAEGGRQRLTLRNLVRISERLKIHITDLFKEPFDDVLAAEPRELVQIRNRDGHGLLEERYKSSVNPNTKIKKIFLNPRQARRMKLESRVNLEIIMLRGKMTVSCAPDIKTIRTGEQYAISYNPQLSLFTKTPEYIKFGSYTGAEFLLIQTLVH
ncbi:MAG: helix-turn-helix transcriptional regulator [Bdellovibrionaceae bacterium]|nr:helix-turn-helix transcriptional regulator [Pseudobdellovibrionaceae bacterium]